MTWILPTRMVVTMTLLWLFFSGDLQAIPRIIKVTPGGGAPGTQVVIEGTQLGAITKVFFGDALGNILQRTPNVLVVVVPLDATSAPLYVYEANGNFDYTPLSFQVAPRITAVSPSRGVPGEEVLIDGFNFSNINNLDLAPRVFFNDVQATAFVASDTQLRTIVPPLATTGPVSVQTLAGIHSTPAPFYLPPIIESFTPARARVGDVLTIQGVNFTGATRFQVGGAQATILNAQLRQMTVRIPEGALDGPLFVETPGGAFLSSVQTPFLLLPKINSFDPAGGPVGTTVTIRGTGLAQASQAYFGDKIVSIASKSPTTATCVVPNGALTGPITIQTPSGTNQSQSIFYVSPSVNLINPTRGQTGTVVTVTGLNLLGTTRVEFGGVSTPEFSVESNTRLTTRVPVGAVSGVVRITNPGGSASSSQTYEVTGDEPLISSFTPTFGVAGTLVTLTGLNFRDATNVTFNGVSSIPTVQSDTRLVVAVPAGASSGPLQVYSPKGTGTASQEFIYGDQADLKLTVNATANAPVVGMPMVYSIDVRNNGPLDAAGVVITFAIPEVLEYVNATASRGTFERIGTGVINKVSRLNAGATTTLLVRVKPLMTGTVTVGAQVTSDIPDKQTEDNAAKLVLIASPLTLKLDALQHGFVRIVWPDVATNFVLQCAYQPGLTNWSTVTNVPLHIEDEFRVALPFEPNQNRFYRLRQRE